jgi:hypothetical protein
MGIEHREGEADGEGERGRGGGQAGRWLFLRSEIKKCRSGG